MGIFQFTTIVISPFSELHMNMDLCQMSSDPHGPIFQICSTNTLFCCDFSVFGTIYNFTNKLLWTTAFFTTYCLASGNDLVLKILNTTDVLQDCQIWLIIVFNEQAHR